MVRSLVKAQKKGNIKLFTPVGKIVDAIVIRVIDGDTVQILSKQLTVSNKPMSIIIRVDGMDTPELGSKNSIVSKAARVAKTEAAHFFGGFDDKFVFHGRNVHRVRVEVLRNDKYGGRFVGSIIRVFDKCDFAKHMIVNGYAQHYTGHGGKPVWTRNNVRL